jgi:hypothetical protein
MPTVSHETIVTVLFVYIMIGAVILIALDRLGIVARTFVSRPDVSPRALVLASLMVVAAWPMFVWVWCKGLRQSARRASGGEGPDARSQSSAASGPVSTRRRS